MPRVALTGGAYESRSVISEAQRCVNLYPEMAPSDAPVPVTHYPTPGLRLLGTAADAPADGIGWRGLYTATNGALYGVCGHSVYFISSTFGFTKIGTIASNFSIVSMDDNGSTLVLVDGTAAGYAIDLFANTMSAINDPAFYGADRVAFMDTYFLFNKPGTPQFYSSDSLSTTFDPLWFANKTAGADYIVSLAVAHREIYLLGTFSSEVWIDAGAPDFPFQAMQGVFIDYGCAAKASVARQDNSLFWLGQDKTGRGIIMKGAEYRAVRISTHAIENAIAGYSKISDAEAFCYQQGGHPFYVLSFPTADKTWVYDIASSLWHERCWSDTSGVEHRIIARVHASAYRLNIVGDLANGNLYALDTNTFTDNGAAIKRLRSFPHMVQDGKRVIYRMFTADMQVGTGAGDMQIPGDPEPDVQRGLISLRYSDTRGASWSDPLMNDLGALGEFNSVITFQRLGMARDRVWEVSWTTPTQTALNGAFVDFETSTS